MKFFLFALILSVASSCGFKTIDTGHRGILVNFGRIEGEPLLEGLHFYNPFTHDLVEIAVQEKRQDGDTSAFTKDVQNVKVLYALNYRPDEAKIHIMFKDLGIDWENKIIPPVVLAKIKEVVSQYEAVQLVENRNKASDTMRELITAELARKKVTVVDFEIINLDFNDEFERAVEDKVVAVQRAQEAINKTVQIREEKDQAIIRAQGEAESMKIRSASLAQNRNLIEYEAVQKWDGKLPQVSGGHTPFINFTK